MDLILARTLTSSPGVNTPRARHVRAPLENGDPVGQENAARTSSLWRAVNELFIRVTVHPVAHELLKDWQRAIDMLLLQKMLDNKIIGGRDIDLCKRQDQTLELQSLPPKAIVVTSPYKGGIVKPIASVFVALI